MSRRHEELDRQVRRWLRYADEDLRVARQTLLMKPCPYRLAAFHAQQCAEKCLKAYLIRHEIDFAYSHNISYLLELAEDTAPWGKGIEEADRLTHFAVTVRYPAERRRLTRVQTQKAIALAEQVRRAVRRALRSNK
ncbi:MAG: HEPN domain-containing protein [Kiritimatiellae bacterium]|nr:HEPN domain-containing protein [Kiritimatiellia bacterium]